MRDVAVLLLAGIMAVLLGAVVAIGGLLVAGIIETVRRIVLSLTRRLRHSQ